MVSSENQEAMLFSNEKELLQPHAHEKFSFYRTSIENFPYCLRQLCFWGSCLVNSQVFNMIHCLSGIKEKSRSDV